MALEAHLLFWFLFRISLLPVICLLISRKTAITINNAINANGNHILNKNLIPGWYYAAGNSFKNQWA